MKSKFLSGIMVLITIIILLNGCGVENSGPVDSKNQYSITQGYDDQYIIIYSDNKASSIQGENISESLAKQILTDAGISSGAILKTYSSVVKGFSAKLSRDQVEQLLNDTRIKYIEPDQLYQLPNEIENLDQVHKSASTLAQSVGWGVNATGSANYSGSNKAWIVDTGIDLDHPDLNVNTSLSRTFVTSGADASSADDLNGHGSHCAGIIAAKNNTIGYKGVAANAQLVAIKVLNRYGSGTVSSIVNGLDYISRNDSPGDVVNMSLGGSASTTLDNAVSSLASTGTWVVIAAGNSYANASNYSPARVNADYVVTVSAHSSSNSFASFSNYGSPVDWAAPGVSIPSTYKNGSYASMSGTSMATPHVAGIILSRGGSVASRGTVTGDPDSTTDGLAGR